MTTPSSERENEIVSMEEIRIKFHKKIFDRLQYTTSELGFLYSIVDEVLKEAIAAKDAEIERLTKLEMGDDHTRLMMYRETHATSKKLCDILMNHVGETGQSEGAIEVLERKLDENVSLRSRLSAAEKVVEAAQGWKRNDRESDIKLFRTLEAYDKLKEDSK